MEEWRQLLTALSEAHTSCMFGDEDEKRLEKLTKLTIVVIDRIFIAEEVRSLSVMPWLSDIASHSADQDKEALNASFTTVKELLLAAAIKL